MSDDPHPLCQGHGSDHIAPTFDVPPDTIDSYGHVFGPDDKYSYSPKRCCTPAEASLKCYLSLHQTLGGIDHAVLTQPSIYETDNSCMFDVVDRMNGKFMAIVAADADITDKELEALHERQVRGIRVNLVDKGGMPFAALPRGSSISAGTWNF